MTFISHTGSITNDCPVETNGFIVNPLIVDFSEWTRARRTMGKTARRPSLDFRNTHKRGISNPSRTADTNHKKPTPAFCNSGRPSVKPQRAWPEQDQTAWVEPLHLQAPPPRRGGTINCQHVYRTWELLFDDTSYPIDVKKP